MVDMWLGLSSLTTVKSPLVFPTPPQALNRTAHLVCAVLSRPPGCRESHPRGASVSGCERPARKDCNAAACPRQPPSSHPGTLPDSLHVLLTWRGTSYAQALTFSLFRNPTKMTVNDSLKANIPKHRTKGDELPAAG